MNKIALILKNGGVGVLATDTLYGLVGKALDVSVVNKIYRLKKRNQDKPFIILISGYEQLDFFGIKISKKLKQRLDGYWPGPTSIILSCPLSEFEYLHRGTNSLAFRMPNNKELLELLRYTGPLVAPSANTEGNLPAGTIGEAKKYFGDKIDFYQAGKTSQHASKLIQIIDDEVIILRK